MNINRNFILAVIVVFLIMGIWIFTNSHTNETIDSDKISTNQGDEVFKPDLEQAELTAFGFIQMVIDDGLTNGNNTEKIHTSLSTKARMEVTKDELFNDILVFLQIQEIPEYGASVQNLEVHSINEATLVVGLNYKTGPILRAINMVVESSEWKIDSVDVLDEYPLGDVPDDSQTNNQANSGCFVGGCSSQVCSDKHDVVTTCEWHAEYECYRKAICERQDNGECGWTETDELIECLADATTDL